MSEENKIIKYKKCIQKFDKKLLDTVIARDEATLIGNYDVLNRETNINYICKCGITYNKNFRSIYKNGGALCKKCCYKHALEKRKNTNNNIYGVDNPFQNNDIKNIIKSSNLKKYGVEFATQNKEVQEKTKKTNLIKFGVERPSQNKDIRNKVKATNLKRFGVEHPLQNKLILDKVQSTNIVKYGGKSAMSSDIVKNKVKATNLKRLGVENPGQSEIVKEKMKKTNLKRLGVEYASQSEIIRNKVKATCIKRFGVEYSSQSKEVMEKTQKNAKKYKEYKMPSGEIRKVQGYEPFALDKLVKIYSDDQIKTDRKDVPRIKYNVDGKNKYHFPDIFIPHENKLIEVKSTWTLKCKADNVQLKKEACEKEGYIYEIWCFNNKGESI